MKLLRTTNYTIEKIVLSFTIIINSLSFHNLLKRAINFNLGPHLSNPHFKYRCCETMEITIEQCVESIVNAEAFLNSIILKASFTYASLYLNSFILMSSYQYIYIHKFSTTGMQFLLP